MEEAEKLQGDRRRGARGISMDVWGGEKRKQRQNHDDWVILLLHVVIITHIVFVEIN